MKRIMFEEENNITFSQEQKLENSQDRNWKNKRLINKYLNEHHGFKRPSLCRSKISLWKSRCNSEEHEQKLKTWMVN